jgi:hypothetical protein
MNPTTRTAQQRFEASLVEQNSQLRRERNSFAATCSLLWTLVGLQFVVIVLLVIAWRVLK